MYGPIQEAQAAMNAGVGFILSIGFLAGLFCIMFGAILHFSHYNQGTGKSLLVNGALLMIIATAMNMIVLGNLGPPDITIFFGTGS